MSTLPLELDMGMRKNPDGSVTVGILTVEMPPKPKTAEPVEKAEKPTKGKK